MPDLRSITESISPLLPVGELLKMICKKENKDVNEFHLESIDGIKLENNLVINDLETDKLVLQKTQQTNENEPIVENYSRRHRGSKISLEEFVNVEKSKDKNKFIPNLKLFQMKQIPRRIETKRDNIVYELLSSEQTYVKGLYIIKEFFCRQLLFESWPSYIEECLTRIEKTIDLIKRVNTILLSNLEERISNWNSSATIGFLFFSNSLYF